MKRSSLDYVACLCGWAGAGFFVWGAGAGLMNGGIHNSSLGPCFAASFSLICIGLIAQFLT